MMSLFTKKTMLVFFLLHSFAGIAGSMEIQSKYASISYENSHYLQKFNNRLQMGRLQYLLRGKPAITIEDEVKNKVDVITEKVRLVLAMYPPHLHYSIELLADINGVHKMFIKLHNKDWRSPGLYYAPTNTVYLSIRETKLKIIAHEVGHVIVENYFKISPPVKIHELLAQFAEKHITD